ncbi:MAG: plasmid recombination protein [Clostridia bacterium]|nr:plasmid recombination protein [Clostridia bacterium]MBQ5561883.1 plasmid recombination protein [Clostridia bacterium]
MAIRISTHNGSEAHRAHNIRKDYVVSKQEHIDAQRSPLNEIWADEAPQDAYQRIFGAAVEEYNQKQKRADRKIKDYYRQICADKKKHPVYEMIIQVGGMDDNIPIETHKAILKEFYENFCEQNDSFECIGAYLHLDEATPHLHIDYIPVATGYKNGMSIQTGLVKALEQMGYSKTGKETAQIQWERNMNMLLETICVKYGLQIEHLRLGTAHLDTETYKVLQEVLKIAREDLSQVWRNRIKKTLDLCSGETRCEFNKIYKSLEWDFLKNTDRIMSEVNQASVENAIKKRKR